MAIAFSHGEERRSRHGYSTGARGKGVQPEDRAFRNRRGFETWLDNLVDGRGRSPSYGHGSDGDRYFEHERANEMGEESLWTSKRTNLGLHRLESRRTNGRTRNVDTAELGRSV